MAIRIGTSGEEEPPSDSVELETGLAVCTPPPGCF